MVINSKLRHISTKETMCGNNYVDKEIDFCIAHFHNYRKISKWIKW